MITIALVNSKGGVGKTTLAASLALEAAKETVGKGKDKRPANVALVDLDPQQSLLKWWQTRGSLDNPELLEGVEDAYEAIDRLEYMHYDYVIIDSPPAFMNTIDSCIACADFIVIPVRASMLDVAATEDALIATRDAGVSYTLVLNDVHKNEGVVTATREWLGEQGINISDTQIEHRVAHTYGMMSGQSGSERINGKIDVKAQEQLSALWSEVKAMAIAAHQQRNEAAE